jgi:integrase/recombinase XerC
LIKNKKPNLRKFKIAIEKFLFVITEVRRLSPATVKAYKGDLTWLHGQVCIDAERIEAFEFFKPSMFRAYVSLMKKKNKLSSRSISRRISSWRVFFDWLCEQNEVDTGINIGFNPLRGIRPPRLSQLLPKALSVDEAVKFVSSFKPNESNFLLIRDKAICELIYSSGLRVSEVETLDLCRGSSNNGWIDYEGAFAEVFGKRAIRRRVPVGKKAINALKDWLKTRGSLVKTNKIKKKQDALFTNKNGGRLSSRGIERRFQIHSQVAFGGQSVHPHMLRHSFASHLLQSSGDLRAVQDLLGHSKISSTQIYTKLDFQHLSQVYDLAHPRAFTKIKNPDASD